MQAGCILEAAPPTVTCPLFRVRLGPSGWQPRNLPDMEEEGLTLHLGRKLLELTFRVGEEEELDPQKRLIFIATCVGLVSKGQQGNVSSRCAGPGGGERWGAAAQPQCVPKSQIGLPRPA